MWVVGDTVIVVEMMKKMIFALKLLESITPMYEQ